ncbi:MAG TPA: hypothetical protein VJK51_00040 [Candidatus Nanoarchaeia archaeon]|nr:hypothetical protein [Candidatus Nanoarchaeia archaeon]
MRIRLKQLRSFGVHRADVMLKVDSVLVKENLVDPSHSLVELMVRGKSGSGIVTLSQRELETLQGSVKPIVSIGKSKVKKK